MCIIIYFYTKFKTNLKQYPVWFFSCTLVHDHQRIFEQHCVFGKKYVLGPKVAMLAWCFLLGKRRLTSHKDFCSAMRKCWHTLLSKAECVKNFWNSRLSFPLNNTLLLTNSILERKSIGTTRKRQFTKCWWIIAQSLSITIGSRIWMATARHESHAVLT